MFRMFWGASAFNQDLCRWGGSMRMEESSVFEMFFFTSCPRQETPNLRSVYVTPLCFSCEP
jgi:hypothetical protein